jgi:NO-binding membrane sensor protein with MHYT domain
MTYELKRCRRRNPVIWLAMIALAAVLGISSRRFAAMLPGFIAAYAGDTLWALAAFLGFGLILPRVSTRTITMLALAFSVAIELSQLYHTPWIDSIRHTTLGGLILGFGFLWSDLVCYALGVGLGVLVDVIGGIVPGKDRS